MMRMLLRAVRLVVAAVLGLELVYLLVGNWLLASRLDDIGVRATWPLTLYPGDVRARQVELNAAEGSLTIRATQPRGWLRVRSVFTGTLELRSVEAERIDVAVRDVDALFRETREPDSVGTARLSPASLLTVPIAPSGVIVDSFRAPLGELKIAGITLRGEARVELRSVQFTPRLSALDATLNGKGEDAGVVLQLLRAPESVRWMFQELERQPFTFDVTGVVRPADLRIERFDVRTRTIRAHGSVQFAGDGPQGKILLERGTLRAGLLLAGGERRIVMSPASDWLSSAIEPSEAQPLH